MALKIKALSGVSEKGKLNSEWIMVVNEGDRAFNADGCSITVSKGTSRPRVVTTFKAGIIIKPNETCRLITGSSGKGSHGDPPVEEDVRNVHLYLKAPYLDRPGLVVRIMNRQREVCQFTYDPSAPSKATAETT